MTQEPLFKDLSDRFAAIGADVDAAGGEKVVGSILWPSITAERARQRMSHVLNPRQRHELTDKEVWTIKQLARKASGRSWIVEFECGALHADIKWISQEQQIERKEQQLEKLLGQVFRELQELKAIRK